MDENELNRSLTRQRKISSSFRDTQLLEIFTLSCNLLKQANRNIKSILLNGSSESSTSPERNLLFHLLQLSLNCLLFDFIGTTTNEDASDDLSTVQIPTTWRSSMSF
jgi:exportin-7